MSDVDLTAAVQVLRDEVLDTVHHGDRDPPGTEVFEALLRTLAAGRERAGRPPPDDVSARRDARRGESAGSAGREGAGRPPPEDAAPGIDHTLHDAVTRRLAWGDREDAVLADAERIFDRLMISVERAFRDPADQLVVIEAATEVAVTVSRVVALAAITRAGRDRAARLREELAQRQLREVLDKQRATLARLELELKQDFR